MMLEREPEKTAVGDSYWLRQQDPGKQSIIARFDARTFVALFGIKLRPGDKTLVRVSMSRVDPIRKVTA